MIDHLRQILAQILDNAIKFTPHRGTVFIAGSANQDQAVVDVKDSGEGIPLEMRERIFEKFFQAEKALTRRSGGTGLGLYLARALTELHGGNVRVVADDGPGAHIQICLPVEGSNLSLKNKDNRKP